VPSPALAAPSDPGSASTAADDSERPVHVVLGRLEPRTVTPGAVLEVSGTLVNESDKTYRDLSVRLQRGDVLTTRAALATDVADPDDATAATTGFQPVDGELDPGGSLPFRFQGSSDELQLTGDGVYPLLVNVNGTGTGGQTERVGELSTYLVSQPVQPVHRTAVAWLWPFTDRPHRNADGAFTDDDLAGEVARNGRLERLVRTLESIPPLPGGDPAGSTRPEAPVTLAVDPALLEELSVMAAGRYTVDGKAGSGSADAADLLDRLKTVATELPVVVLPYADADVDSLVAAGLGAVAARTLPGTAAGTARQPLGSGNTPTTAPTTSAGGSPSTSASSGSGGTDGATTGAGAAIVRSVLGVQPRTDVAWPAAGPVHADTLRTLQAGGARSVVLGSDVLTHAASATGQDGTPAAARAPLDGTDGPDGALTALVADSRLADTVAGAAQTDDARVSEQRYLADLAVLTTQQDAADPALAQTVLVVPPRELDADPEWAGAMIADTAEQPWLQPAALTDLAAGPASAPVATTQPATDRGLLPAEATAGVARAERVRDDVAGAVVGNADTTLAGYDAAMARTASVAWREEPEGSARSATDLVDTLGSLQAQVTLVAPTDGTYSLASSDAPLVLTVQNDLPFAVEVRLDLRTRGNVGLTTDDIGVTRLDPQSRTLLQVPAHVQQSGGFSVTARLQTPDGGPLGAAVQLQVKSTAYGRVTVWLTVGAAALLALLFLRRLVRFLLARRRGTPDDEPVDPATVPPTRSPV
jgi:hypothetical protein